MPPQPPLSPDQIIALLQHGLVYLGSLVFAHPLTILFVVVAMGLFALLPEFVSVTVILLVIAVLVYLFGH